MESVDNLIIEHLRAMRADIASIKDDVREIKTRITHVEAGIASLKRDNAHQYDESAAANARFDRLAERIEKNRTATRPAKLN